MKESTSTSNSIEIIPTKSYCVLLVFGLILFSIILFICAILWYNLLSIPSVVVLSLAFYQYLYVRNIRYTLTNDVLKIRVGLLGYTLNTIELYRVKDYVIHQSFLMRSLKIMSIDIYTTDTLDKIVRLKGIPESNIGDVLRDLIHNARMRSKIIELN